MVVTEVNKAEPQGGESLKENEAHASSISLPVTDVLSQSLVVQIHFNDANHDAHCMPPPHTARVSASFASVGVGSPISGYRGRECVLIPEFLMLQVCRNKRRQHQQQQQQKSPSENLSLIAPICSGAASPHRLPGCLPQTLSSTLFSISCNHLLEIYFSFKMSPGNQNQLWRRPAQDEP